MHDYGSLHWRGAEKAVDEFFAAKSDAVIPLPDTAGSVVVRKPRISDPCENWLVRRLNNILSREWVDVENGLTELLGNGWAGAEPWGIWGLEGLHELKLFLPRPHIEKVQLDVDAHVYLGPGRSQKVVDVWAENEKIASWTFTREQNRAVRSLHIPPSVILNPDRKAPAISIEFRPDSAEPPSSLDSSTKDSRPLGMGLHRVRRLI